jgi:hypothetical protein
MSGHPSDFRPGRAWTKELAGMDEGTIKTPIPKCRLYWCFCLGWCSQFVGFVFTFGRGGGGEEAREKVL